MRAHFSPLDFRLSAPSPALLGPAGEQAIPPDLGNLILKVCGRQEAPVGRGVETSLHDGPHSLDLRNVP